ncbi:hypothetical protein [Paenibacillus cremeus]|uniref:Uncharacterized protein n=1 Tax=Paenibacillus cremeus TaxID=2163881 RepID=A0A559KCK6_9BACL|nr:hypothetical protein [Paenibacillus cremeus]TVY09855.1 hypothetical protein FPZ49_10810 [Paenibacillus cremeus]
MQKYRVYAKDNLELFPHTWTKDLDYELIQKEDHFTLASNEGQINILGKASEKLVDIFEVGFLKNGVSDFVDFLDEDRMHFRTW